MPTSQPDNKRRAIARLRPLGASLLIATVATVAVGALYVRLGPVWPYRILPLVPDGIVVHHSATDTGIGLRADAAFLDRAHKSRGWGLRYGQRVYHIGYHYVILPDGTVQPGRPEWMPGAHTMGYNHYLGICLIGDFSDREARTQHLTDAQLDALVNLTVKQMRRHNIPTSRLFRHCDLAATKCPGAGLPWEQILKRVKAGLNRS